MASREPGRCQVGLVLVVCTLASLLVPGNRAERRGVHLEPQLASAHESG
ncbi:MAG: hypothetical protein ACR2JH_10545 [Solirubrobacteraceae bacterium]